MNTPETVVSVFTTVLNQQSEKNREKILKEITATFCVGCGKKHEDTERGRCQCENDE